MQTNPSRSKYKKQQKGKSFNRINKLVTFNRLNFGILGLQAQEAGRITSKQIESIQQTINKIIKKSGKIVINAFPHTPITKKPLEIRMGKGKGNVDHYVVPVKPGRILFEAEGVSLETAQEALRLAAQKLPCRTKFIVRPDYTE
jgi:large subunit ribosomal protein L16